MYTKTGSNNAGQLTNSEGPVIPIWHQRLSALLVSTGAAAIWWWFDTIYLAIWASAVLLVVAVVCLLILPISFVNWTKVGQFAQKRVELLTRLTVLLAVICLLGRMLGFIGAPGPKEESIAAGLTQGYEMVGGAEVHYIIADLQQITPRVLAAPNFTNGKRKLSEMVNEEKEHTITAVNGDYFDEGGPQGFFKTGANARMTAPNSSRAALSFDTNGSAKVELYRFTTDARVEANGVACPIRQSYNTMYLPGDVGVYTVTRGSSSGAAVRKDCEEGAMIQARVQITMGQEGHVYLSGHVREVVHNPNVNMVPKQDEFIVVAANEQGTPLTIGTYAWAHQNLLTGSPVAVYLSVTPLPSGSVISGGPELIRFGQYYARTEGNERLALSRTARTAVGITKSGRYLFAVVVEGPPKATSIRQGLKCVWWYGWASGIGLTHLSSGMTLQELGIYFCSKEVFGEQVWSALNLDGGGSSTMVVKRPGDRTRVVNDVMDGHQRQLANALAFVPR